MRKCYIICLELNNPLGTYSPLIDAIKSFRTWAKITKSTWAIVTESDVKSIRDYLGQHLYDGDRLFVIKSGRSSAWKNAIVTSDWLKKNLKLV